MTAKKKVVAKNRTQYADLLNHADGTGKGNGFNQKQWRVIASWVEAREIKAILKNEKSPILAIRAQAKKKATMIKFSLKCK